jgi:hypothetical protein
MSLSLLTVHCPYNVALLHFDGCYDVKWLLMDNLIAPIFRSLKMFFTLEEG